MKHQLTFGVIGETGQLARALKAKSLVSRHEVSFLNRDDCDLAWTEHKICTALAPLSEVDAIIIAAAYTHVDRAENEPDIVMRANAVAPAIIANWAQNLDIPVVFISTDYVFSGLSSDAYKTDDDPAPINVYGRAKLEGEQAVLAANSGAAIIRTSWLYDARCDNFLTKMLSLSRNRKSLDVVSDQIGRPTFADNLADTVLRFTEELAIRNSSFQGIFHVTDGGEPVSWAGFAREIFHVFEAELARQVTVNDVSTSNFPTLAKRPSYSVLDISKAEALLGHDFPDWRDGVKKAREDWIKCAKGVNDE